MKRIAALALTALAIATPCHAQVEDEATARLRDALRNTMLQLRDAQGQIAALQAKDIANTREIASLKAEVKSLGDQAISERNASANTIAELREKLSDREATIAAHEAALAKWRKDFGDAIARARKAEAESLNKTGAIQDLERLAEDQRAQNVHMYRAGMDVLERYDKFWFGDALLAREPFVGATKVKLQNLAQDGHDKLLAARIRGSDKSDPSDKSDKSDKSDSASQPASQQPTPSPKPEASSKKKPAKAKAKADGDRTAWPAARPASNPQPSTQQTIQ